MMIKNILMVKVSLMKQLWRFAAHLMITYNPFCAKGELDDDDEDEWRDGDDNESIDNEALFQLLVE